LIVDTFRKVTAGPEADFQPKVPVGLALLTGGTLSIVVVLASWCLVGSNAISQDRPPPALSLIGDLRMKRAAASSFDLRSFKAGYHLRITDDAQPTSLPNISRKDFIQNLPRGYLPFASQFKQLSPGAEVVALPYWVWLVLDEADARAGRFTPMPEQTGHPVSQPVYFSKGLHIEDR
jgi:hypothetical protein